MLPGGGEEAKFTAEQKEEVGTLENHQVSVWHNSDLSQKPIHWEFVF